jgi:hypothetical protein
MGVSMRSYSLTSLAAVTALAALSALSGACAGRQAGKPNDLMDRTHAGKNRCVSDGNEHQLFLVEWDATDLSSFEAKAGRDLVMVKYEACQMKVLHGCSDDGIAGRYGSYRKPELTSGNIEGFTVKTQDDLYAKLPLGAATLGGEFSRGKALELKYFVSGQSTSTRDAVYRDDIKDNPRCAGATHFVASYALGAFVLDSKEASKVGATVGAGAISGGASHADDSALLKQGGKLDSCTSFDQAACRVPIRVALRPLTDGARPAIPTGADGSSPSSSPPQTDGALAAAQGMMGGVQLRSSAEHKLMAGDAAGCLTDLDRADSTDRQGGSTPAVKQLRARCEMRAGRCDEGKKHFREARAAWHREFDRTGLTTDATLDAEAEQMARSTCPSAATGGVPPQMATIALLQKIMHASASKDAAACVTHGKAMLALASAPGADADPMVKQGAAGGLRTAAICAGDGGKCADARALWGGFAKAFDGSTGAEADASFKENVKSCSKK